MNKVYNINLGGYPFVIDEDAYDQLRTYLAALNRHFQHSEGCEEIIADIENRMAELLQERLVARQIVTLPDIRESIKILGSPEDFSGDEDAFGNSAEDQNAENTYRTGRRLFRNTEDKVIKGVCSGLAAYFGIQDPIWIRIAFALAFVSGGLGLPLYLILWAIMPEAKTAADRLAMRGEPINVSNIAKTVEEELNSLSDTLVEIGQQFTSKKNPGANEDGIAGTIKKGFYVLGRTVSWAIELIGKIARPIITIIAVALIIFLAFSWIAMLFGFFYSLPFAGYFFPGNSGLSSLMLMNIYFIFAIPLGFMILFFVRLINRHRLNPRIRTGMWIFFSLNVVSLFALGSLMLSHFNSKSLESDVKATLNVDTLHIEHLYNPMQESLMNFGNLKLGDDYLISNDVFLNFTSTENADFEIVETREGRGKTQEEAQSFLDHVNYVSNISDNKLAYQTIFSIPAGNKWRDQKIRLQVNVPVGKFIAFDNNSRRIWLSVKEGNYQHPQAGSIYQMTADGFVCLTCPKEAEAPNNHSN